LALKGCNPTYGQKSAASATVLPGGELLDELIDLNAHLLKGAKPYQSFVGTLDSPQVKGPFRGLLANILLETGGDQRVDCIVVVSAPRAVQMQRIRARRRMSDIDIAAVIARQMPDAEKRRRADVVIRTGLSRHASQKALSRLIREVLQ
jgi:hypothetical protein